MVASERVDGAALRRRIRKRLSGDTSPVTVLRGGTARELGERICQAAVPEKVPASLPVLIKPNLGGFAWFKNPQRNNGDNGLTGRTTDPEFVRGIIRCLRARGHQTITVADGWSAEAKHWKRLIEASGYRAMAAEENVALVALNDDGVFDKTGEQPGRPMALGGMEKTSVPTLLVPKIVAEHLDNGLFISAPKLKTHRFSVISLAIKGMQGTVMYSDAAPAYRQKWRSHRELSPYLKARKKNKGADDRAAYVAALEIFAERMVDVLEVQAPHVVLADGAPAMSGDGFHVLFPDPEPFAIGGTNPVRVDRVGAELMGLWNNPDLARELGGHSTSPLITAAGKRLGLDLERVEVIGNGAGLLDAPRPVHFIAMAPFTIERKARAKAAEAPASPARSSAAKPVASARAGRPGRPARWRRADEPAWSQAPEIAWQTDYAGRDTGIHTKARFLWSSEALYALFTVEQTDFNTDTSRPIEVEREGLYKEDCVEIFLVPDPSRSKHYYEIEVGPHGHFFDLELNRYPGQKKRNLAWSSELRIATSRDPTARRAVIEIALGARDITRILAPGARIPMGLYRMEGKSPRHYLAWSPPRTPRPKFHVPEAFGTLLLEP